MTKLCETSSSVASAVAFISTADLWLFMADFRLDAGAGEGTGVAKDVVENRRLLLRLAGSLVGRRESDRDEEDSLDRSSAVFASHAPLTAVDVGKGDSRYPCLGFFTVEKPCQSPSSACVLGRGSCESCLSGERLVFVGGSVAGGVLVKRGVATTAVVCSVFAFSGEVKRSFSARCNTACVPAHCCAASSWCM